MSCPHVVWALRQRGLSASERVVLIYLADKANKVMVCWPSLHTIAAAVELSPRTVHSAVHRLQALTLIRIETRGQHSNHYHILRPIEDGETTPPQINDANPHLDNQPPAGEDQPVPQPVDSENFALPDFGLADFAEPVLQDLQDKPESGQAGYADSARPVLQILQDTPPNGPQPGFFGLANFANESPKEVSKKKRKREVLSSREDQTKVVEAWNLMASLAKLPKVVGLSDDRKQQLAARLEEHGLEGVLQAVTAIGDSAFCRGKNDRGWVASFDFLIQAKSCLKAIEGCYDNRTPIGRSGRPVILSEFDGKPIPQVAGFC
jgi:hypothetical protein